MLPSTDRAPLVDRLKRFALTISIAVAGGLAASLVGIPAPWLSGPAVAVAAVALSGVGVAVLPPVRTAALVFLGATMGASVTPETLTLMTRWPVSLAGLAVCVMAIMMSIAFYLERVHGYDRATARLSGVPGALPFVLALAAESSGDARRIAIIQMMRLAILLICMPSLLTVLGVHGTAALPASVSAPIVPWELVLLFALSWLGGVLFERLGAPAGMLFGAMVTGAVLFGSGAIRTGLPAWLMLPGFVAIGAMVGANFSGTDRRLFLDTMLAGLGSVVVGGVVALACALPVAWVLDLHPAQIWLAYAPGGVDVMAIMALALGLDAAFVGGHHVLRFLGLGLIVPIWLREHLKRRAPS